MHLLADSCASQLVIEQAHGLAVKAGQIAG